MSDHVFLPEQVCYINCSFCNTTLLVYVAPLSLSLAKFLVVLHIQQQQRRSVVFLLPITGSSSKSPDEMFLDNLISILLTSIPMLRFLFLYREEIRRLKTKNPNISHKEAFSTAAKNVSMYVDIEFIKY
ncbi:hypothetical protein BHE74_00003648 [Ensete ventricosum]|nr:hypothetical protein BHE74_00003648 [Ensete ventricosum]